MTALDIMNQARERLGDIKKQRWTDNRLLDIVSQGQVDMCIASGYLRKTAIIPLSLGESIYQLPSDCITIKRVEYKDEKLPLHTRNDIDTPRATLTDYTAYKSNLNMDKLEIRPAPTELITRISFVMGDASDDSFQVTPLYGVVTRTDDTSITVEPKYGTTVATSSDISDNLPSSGYGEVAGTEFDQVTAEFPNGEYGVTISADYSDVDNRYGFITEVKGHIVSGLYGITANIANKEDTVKVYYVAVPRKLKFNSALMSIPDIWEEILMKYVIGTALQDDNDANNIQRGELELQKYNVKLLTISDLSSKDFSANASDKNETDFRRV